LRQKYFKRKNKKPKNFSILAANQRVSIANNHVSDKSKLNELSQLNEDNDFSQEFYKENNQENKHSISYKRYLFKKI
jgi:hypothetical protein